MTAACRCVLQLLLLTGVGTAVLVAAVVSSETDGSTAVRSPSSGYVLGREPARASGAVPAATTAPSSSAAGPFSLEVSVDAATSSSPPSAAAAPAVASTVHDDAAAYVRAQPRSEGKSGFGRQLWRRFLGRKFDKYHNPGLYAGVVAWEPDSDGANVTRIVRRASSHSLFTSDSPPTLTVLPTSEKRKSKALCLFRCRSRHSPWGLLGNLGDPPPPTPPTVQEFAAALHVDLHKVYGMAVAGETQAKSQPSGLRLRGPFVAQRRRRRNFLNRHSIGETPQGIYETLNGGGKISTSFEEPASTSSNSSGSGTAASAESSIDTSGGGGSGRGSGSVTGEDSCSRSQMSDHQEDRASESATNDETGNRTPDCSAASTPGTGQGCVLWLPGVKIDEQQLIGQIVTSFVTERRQPQDPPGPPVPEAAAREAVQWMYSRDRLKGFLNGSELRFTWHTCVAGGHPQVWTTAYVLSTADEQQQQEYMQKILTDLRSMLWAWRRLKGGTNLQPWQAAEQYNLYIPLDVIYVEGEGPLLPASEGRMIVNSFLTREVLLCTLDELLQMRPSDSEEEHESWHLTRLSLSVQAVHVLSKLSEAGISVGTVAEKTLALTARGALVLTYIEPNASVPAGDARAAARLLFRLWCRGTYDAYITFNDPDNAKLETFCSQRMPRVVAYAIETLDARESQTRMSLQVLRNSQMFRDLATSLPVVARRLQGQL